MLQTLTKEDHEFINHLRRKGCCVVVYTADELRMAGASANDLEGVLLEKASGTLDRWARDHDSTLDPEDLEAKYGDEHPDYRRDEWLQDVDNEVPGISHDYWPWVRDQIQGV